MVKSIRALRKKAVLFWNNKRSALREIWLGSDTPDTDESEMALRKSLGLPLPQPDECHYSRVDGQFCRRRKLPDSEMCFWHHRNVDKYRESTIAAYFGADHTIKTAIEKEVAEGNSLMGAYLRDAHLGGNAFLRGADLSKADLRFADLGGAVLSYGLLQGANLSGADLEEAYLSEVDIRDCNFYQAKLHNAKFRLNDFSGVTGLGKANFLGWKNWILPRYHMLEEQPQWCRGVYRSLGLHFQSMGAVDDASWASYKEREMLRQMFKRGFLDAGHLFSEIMGEIGRRRTPGLKVALISASRLLSGLLEFLYLSISKVLCGYGERPFRVIVSSTIVVLLYALAYSLSGVVEELSTGIYLSVLTFLTVTDGSLSLQGNYRALLATEAFAGVFLIGLFLFTLGRRTGGRG